MVDPTFTPHSAVDKSQSARIEYAPLPTDRTLRRRQGLGLQLVRFAGINIRMMRVIFAKHA